MPFFLLSFFLRGSVGGVGFIEMGKEKAVRYFPDPTLGDLARSFEPSGISVSIANMEMVNANVFTYLVVERAGVKRKVIHLHFTGWPDKGLPTEMGHLLEVSGLRVTTLG